MAGRIVLVVRLDPLPVMQDMYATAHRLIRT
jgi:hypothetical protein